LVEREEEEYPTLNKEYPIRNKSKEELPTLNKEQPMLKENS
jgi:hypothetical protein